MQNWKQTALLTLALLLDGPFTAPTAKPLKSGGETKSSSGPVQTRWVSQKWRGQTFCFWVVAMPRDIEIRLAMGRRQESCEDVKRRLSKRCANLIAVGTGPFYCVDRVQLVGWNASQGKVHVRWHHGGRSILALPHNQPAKLIDQPPKGQEGYEVGPSLLPKFSWAGMQRSDGRWFRRVTPRCAIGYNANRFFLVKGTGPVMAVRAMMRQLGCTRAALTDGGHGFDSPFHFAYYCSH